MAEASGRAAAGDAVAGLRSRSAALRQAAASPNARQQELLDAALAELDGAIHALTAGGNGVAGSGRDDQVSGAHSDRRLLHAVFAQAPVALLVVDPDSTVRRANSAACELLGVGPGYATGKTLISMVDPASQAPLRSQLAAVLRSGTAATVGCSLLAATGTVSCQLGIRVLSLRGDEDRLLVAAAAAEPGSAGPAPASRGAGRPRGRGKAREAADQEIIALTRRNDLLLAAACLLLDNAAASESVILQRCARLLAGDLATWVIVDVHRRGALRRHFVAGPDDPSSARLTQSVAAVTPDPDAVSFRVCESGSSALVTHAEDEEMLGRDADGSPLLAKLGGVSVLSVPLTDDSRSFGALTLVRDAAAGAFRLPDVGLVEQVADLLARAIAARRLLTRQTEAAEALRSSLLPPVLRAVPGVEIVAAHMPPTRGREVGGDFYDVYPTPRGWGVAIGDVCGKGDDAAAATACARHAIRVLSHWNPDPAEVLRGANEIMLAEEFGSRFVTADAAHLSWDNRTLRVLLASAGHPGPVLLSPDGRTRLLTGGGVALGIFPDPEPAAQELHLEPGDVLFFFTDGLTGARSPQQTYLEEILTDRLAGLTGRPPAEIVSEMRRVVLEFSDGVLLDDLTMLAVRVGLPPES
jgi:serine phosphatase RsbU (regulator of sigma subunit)/PAS domain-containing protein